MPALRIPAEYERGFVFVSQLPEADFGKILGALNEASPTSYADDMVLALGKVADYTKEDLETFVDTLLSLYRLRSHADIKIDDFIDDLAGAIREGDNKDLQAISPERLSALVGRLKSLLTVRSILMRTKVRELRTDFANIFYDAKMISDIRPVWNGDVTQAPEGVVVTNTLKLEYHHVGGHGEIYICLDADDLDILASVLRRAQDKMRTLKSLPPPGNWMKFLD